MHYIHKFRLGKFYESDSQRNHAPLKQPQPAAFSETKRLRKDNTLFPGTIQRNRLELPPLFSPPNAPALAKFNPITSSFPSRKATHTAKTTPHHKHTYREARSNARPSIPHPHTDSTDSHTYPSASGLVSVLV
jgi:hypothetical protein